MLCDVMNKLFTSFWQIFKTFFNILKMTFSRCSGKCFHWKWCKVTKAFYKKVFLEISQNSQESTCARVSFLIKLQAWGSGTIFKSKALAKVFSCEFCEISKNTFSYRTPPVAASEVTIKQSDLKHTPSKKLWFSSLQVFHNIILF